MPTTIPKKRLEQSEGLNVGSGPHYAPGWVNIDVAVREEESPPPDVVVDIFNLGSVFPPRIFQKAYVGHVLEHLEYDLVPQALSTIARHLVPGGTIMVVGPCILKAVETRQPPSLIQAIVADPRQRFDPAAHSWTPTTALTLEAMRAAGLEGVRECPVAQVSKPGWPNPSTAAWQVAAFGFAS